MILQQHVSILSNTFSCSLIFCCYRDANDQERNVNKTTETKGKITLCRESSIDNIYILKMLKELYLSSFHTSESLIKLLWGRNALVSSK